MKSYDGTIYFIIKRDSSTCKNKDTHNCSRRYRAISGASTPSSMKNGLLINPWRSSVVFRSLVTKFERQFCVTCSRSCSADENHNGRSLELLNSPFLSKEKWDDNGVAMARKEILPEDARNKSLSCTFSNSSSVSVKRFCVCRNNSSLTEACQCRKV